VRLASPLSSPLQSVKANPLAGSKTPSCYTSLSSLAFQDKLSSEQTAGHLSRAAVLLDLGVSLAGRDHKF
jgi:hypothetical protein